MTPCLACLTPDFRAVVAHCDHRVLACAVRIGGVCSGCCQNSAGSGAGAAPCPWSEGLLLAPLLSQARAALERFQLSWYGVMPTG